MYWVPLNEAKYFVIAMSHKTNDEMSGEEKMLREKARQALNENKTTAYSSDDEGGVDAGPTSKGEMKRQEKEDDK